VDPLAPFPQTELQLKTDAVLAELSRIHATWAAGRTPRSTELLAIADDLAALRAITDFAGVVQAYEAPAFAQPTR
jgi:hypothetical protein